MTYMCNHAITSMYIVSLTINNQLATLCSGQTSDKYMYTRLCCSLNVTNKASCTTTLIRPLDRLIYYAGKTKPPMMPKALPTYTCRSIIRSSYYSKGT